MSWFWSFKKKDTEKQNVLEQNINTTTIGVLDGFDDPWRIEKIGKSYTIEVFRLDNARWNNLVYCPYEVIGVQRGEFENIIEEVYNGRVSEDKGTLFERREDAEKAIEEFRSYYDSYHTPKAIANRLLYYCEGGYPPYFIEHVDESKLPEWWNDKK